MDAPGSDQVTPALPATHGIAAAQTHSKLRCRGYPARTLGLSARSPDSTVAADPPKVIGHQE